MIPGLQSNHVTRNNRRERQETGAWLVTWTESYRKAADAPAWHVAPQARKYFTVRGANDKARDLQSFSTWRHKDIPVISGVTVKGMK